MVKALEVLLVVDDLAMHRASGNFQAMEVQRESVVSVVVKVLQVH